MGHGWPELDFYRFSIKVSATATDSKAYKQPAWQAASLAGLLFEYFQILDKRLIFITAAATATVKAKATATAGATAPSNGIQQQQQ